MKKRKNILNGSLYVFMVIMTASALIFDDHLDKIETALCLLVVMLATYGAQMSFEEVFENKSELLEMKRQRDEAITERDRIAEKAFVMGYFNTATPPASFVDDIADGNLIKRWECCKEEIFKSIAKP